MEGGEKRQGDVMKRKKGKERKGDEGKGEQEKTRRVGKKQVEER